MTLTITEKQLRMGIAAVVAVVLAAICVWVLLPSKNVADACVPIVRTATGELINPVDCSRPTSSSGNSAPYQSGVSDQPLMQAPNGKSRYTILKERGELPRCAESQTWDNIGRCIPCSEQLAGGFWVPEINACSERVAVREGQRDASGVCHGVVTDGGGCKPCGFTVPGLVYSEVRRGCFLPSQAGMPVCPPGAKFSKVAGHCLFVQ